MNNNTFVGNVESVDDPLQLGRVKVRVINHHEELSVDDLQWMTVGSPTTSASVKGIGTSPTWLIVGSLVYGMYFDGPARQVPIVMGTIATIPNMDTTQHGVNPLARGITQQQEQPGPDITGQPKYSYNKVIQTPGGHVIEIDDTPSNKRIVVKHASGSSISINANGEVIAYSVSNIYHLTKQDINISAEGDINQKGKTINLVSNSDINITSKGKCSVESDQKITLTAPSVSIK